MPLLDNKLLMLGCQAFGVAQFLCFQADRLTKNDLAFHFENSFAAALRTWT